MHLSYLKQPLLNESTEHMINLEHVIAENDSILYVNALFWKRDYFYWFWNKIPVIE